MKTLTPAAVNRALDALNAKPRKNPRAKRTATQWKAEIVKIETMVKNADNRAAYDAARWLYDEAQDEYSKAANDAQARLRKIMESLNESRYGNPPRKTRAVRVMAANPLVKEAKSNKKANFPYCVQTQNTENWNTSACFKMKTEAVEYARALSEKYPHLPIRVMHFAGGPM